MSPLKIALPQKQGGSQGRFSIGREVKTGFLSDSFNLWAFAFCVLLVALQVAVVIFYWKKLPAQIPLLYSMPWGLAMLASRSFIWILPAIGFFLTIINFSLVIFLLRDNRFLARVLGVASLVVGFCTFYGTVKIVTLLA